LLRVLERNSTGHYAVCGHTWHGLQLVDYALLSELPHGCILFQRQRAYITPSEKNALPKLLQKLFPHLEVSIRPLPPVQNRRWLEFEVKRCEGGGLWNGWQGSGCRQLSVVSVSGTDISRIADYAENLRMWTEPVALQILQTMFPTIRIWPRDSASMVIRTIHDILNGLGLEDNQWHYSEILEYVQKIPREQEVVVTGHSLGGGIALVVGALTDRLAVAIQPPGVFYSLAKHETLNKRSGHGALHQRPVPPRVVSGEPDGERRRRNGPSDGGKRPGSSNCDTCLLFIHRKAAQRQAFGIVGISRYRGCLGVGDSV
ncbi:Uncharacterized protein SCF082_LOCUS42130, partial [Durusdinium trenchii]